VTGALDVEWGMVNSHESAVLHYSLLTTDYSLLYGFQPSQSRIASPMMSLLSVSGIQSIS
jgi:hypothetical protein